MNLRNHHICTETLVPELPGFLEVLLLPKIDFAPLSGLAVAWQTLSRSAGTGTGGNAGF